MTALAVIPGWSIGIEKFNLAEIAADPNLVRKAVLEHLRSLMYDNIARVRVLYQAVLNIDLFKLLSKDDLETLMRAVVYRHDCVDDFRAVIDPVAANPS